MTKWLNDKGNKWLNDGMIIWLNDIWVNEGVNE